ncbi:hypothetical protein [Polaromonas sp. SM01]|uniref:hypothetical protein n=1 Tax=Polaromonas sp. SM01 TaxID=3085630 RepID=UPI002981D719|nr:hypothetical protein [Polaromonas sp. SM01]MDW5442975.1 hypothetical protein [Polaromonas sp. SM01]
MTSGRITSSQPQQRLEQERQKQRQQAQQRLVQQVRMRQQQVLVQRQERVQQQVLPRELVQVLQLLLFYRRQPEQQQQRWRPKRGTCSFEMILDENEKNNFRKSSKKNPNQTIRVLVDRVKGLELFLPSPRLYAGFYGHRNPVSTKYNIHPSRKTGRHAISSLL